MEEGDEEEGLGLDAEAFRLGLRILDVVLRVVGATAGF